MISKTGFRNSGTLNRAIGMLEKIRTIDPEMQAQTVLTLLMVARNPGISQVDIATKLDIAKSTVSRNVTALGDYKKQRSTRGGYGFIEQRIDPENRRYRQLYLTPEGEQAVNQLLAPLD